MALATRCPHCSTSFRVGAEQLAVRDGLVRCGTCSHVFNGVAHLLEPDLPILSEPIEPAARSAAAPAIHLVLPASDAEATDAEPAGDVAPAASRPNHPPFSASSSPFLSAAAKSQTLPAPTIAPSQQAPEASAAPGFLRHPSTDAATVTSHGSSTFFSAPQPDKPLTPGGLRHASPSGELTNDKGDATLTASASGSRDAAWRPAWQKPLPNGAGILATSQPHDKPGSGIADADRPWLHDQRRTWRRHTSDHDDGPAPLPERPSVEPTPVDTGPTTSAWPKPSAFAQAPAAVSAAEPEFVRQARRRGHLSRPARWLRNLGLPLLLTGALLQSIAAFPEQIAVRLPEAVPVIERACKLLDCQTGPATHINAITIEASELQSMASAKNTLVLTVWLHNGSTLAQNWPHLELTLNDFEEQPLVRRVLTPTDYMQHDTTALRQDGLAAGARQTVRVLFELEALQAAGYRVYLFYP